jgi:hypothetical protein
MRLYGYYCHIILRRGVSLVWGRNLHIDRSNLETAFFIPT